MAIPKPNSIKFNNPYLEHSYSGTYSDKNQGLGIFVNPPQTMWYACSGPSTTLTKGMAVSSTNGMLRNATPTERPIRDLNIYESYTLIDSRSCQSCKYCKNAFGEGICYDCFKLTEKTHQPFPLYIPMNEPLTKDIVDGKKIIPIANSELIL